jgi:hypothetical protein
VPKSKTRRRKAAHQPRPLRRIPEQSTAFVGKVNTYTCPIGHVVVTVDRDAGVTPSGMLCRHVEGRGFPVVLVRCDLRATSGWYRVPPGLEPTYEWYRPSDEERRTLNPAMGEHVDMGGLLLRPAACPDPAGPHRCVVPPPHVDRHECVCGAESIEVRGGDHDA